MKGEPVLEPRWLDVLVCPITRTQLTFDAETNELISEAAGLAYRVREGVPVMLVDEARRLNQAANP